MSATKVRSEQKARLQTLPTDEIRQTLWRFADRFDLQMVVQSARGVARGPVARLVAEGERHSHDWTPEKASLLPAFDEAGLTALFIDEEYGGFIQGPKNLALALAAFELAWVDGGAATCSLAGHLALAPIHEKGTKEQKTRYMGLAVPSKTNGQPWRGAFCLTEPIPFVGVDTGVLSGKVRVSQWKEGEEPLLHIDKRGRFITNMAFANFVTAAVESDDERMKGSCMVILEEGDPGVFDRGAPARKLVHQLSSTTDPIFQLDVPASRIVGGYRVEDGVIIPNFTHGQVIESVFRRTRVTVGLMTAAKLLSAVEPVIRYQRSRFRGGGSDAPGSPRHDLGLQQKEDVLHRLVDIWATGEASASLGFAAARFFDDFDPLDHGQEALFESRGIPAGRARLRALSKMQDQAVEMIRLRGKQTGRDEDRLRELESDDVLQFLVKDSIANVLCPAVKLWNTGHGANTMREAVSLMGGYGITEDCPGFLGQKWMDAQLEATYEGPEAVQRRQLSVTMTNPIFLAQYREWIKEMRRVAGEKPGSGACAVASAMELWSWTLRHLLEAKDAEGKPLYRNQRQGVTFPMADALCWLLASRFQIHDVMELEKQGSSNPGLAEGLEGYVSSLSDLCHVQAVRAAGEVARICTELVYGYNRHPSWELDGGELCYRVDEIDALEAVMPGLTAGATAQGDIFDLDGSHPAKAGPCVRFKGMETFVALRNKLDGCMTGGRLAKDRAAHDLTEVMIPEVADYPA